MKKRDNRGNLYLVTALVLGIATGLAYGWLVSPVRYVNTAPNALRADFKDRYRALVAQAFLANQDIGRASARLSLIGDVDSVVALTLQAQRAIAEGRPESEIQALTYLMLALSQSDTPIQLPTPAEAGGLPTVVFIETATPTSSPISTATPVISPSEKSISDTTVTPPISSLPATLTSTAISEPPFTLAEQSLVCEPLLEAPMLQIETQNGQGKSIPGIAITIRPKDEEGEQNFFTGLKPEISLGYADFAMLPGVKYMLWVGEGAQPVDIEPPVCVSTAGDGWGAWKLLFVRP